MKCPPQKLMASKNRRDNDKGQNMEKPSFSDVTERV